MKSACASRKYVAQGGDWAAVVSDAEVQVLIKEAVSKEVPLRFFAAFRACAHP